MGHFITIKPCTICKWESDGKSPRTMNFSEILNGLRLYVERTILTVENRINNQHMIIYQRVIEAGSIFLST